MPPPQPKPNSTQSSLLASLGAPIKAFGPALDGAIAGAKGLTAGLGTVVSAGKAVSDGFFQIADALRPFVEAFAPSSVLAFDEALRDLMAVVGSAAVPIFNALTGTLKEFGGALLPVASEIGPLMSELGDSLLELFAGQIRLFEEVLTAAGPLLNLVVVLNKALSPLVQLLHSIVGMQMSALGTAITAISEALAVATRIFEPFATIVGELRWVFEAFKIVMRGLAEGARSLALAFADWAGVPDLGIEAVGDAMRELAKWVVLATVAMAKWAGALSVVDGITKALSRKRESAVGFGAARDAKVGSDISGFGRELAALAAVASGPPGSAAADPEAAWRADVLASLKAGKDALVGEFLTKAGEVLTASVAEGIKKYVSASATSTAARYGPGAASAMLSGPYGAAISLIGEIYAALRPKK